MLLPLLRDMNWATELEVRSPEFLCEKYELSSMNLRSIGFFCDSIDFCWIIDILFIVMEWGWGKIIFCDSLYIYRQAYKVG